MLKKRSAFFVFNPWLFAGAMVLFVLSHLGMSQAVQAQTSGTKKAENAVQKAQKIKLVLESFEELSLALRLQRNCHILNPTDERALGYYTVQMSKFLNKTQKPATIKALNAKASLDYQTRVKVAKNDVASLCNKEVLTLLEDNLTSATIVNEMLGNEPFDEVADQHRIIIHMLKKTARLQGATKQCGKLVKDPQVATLGRKLSMKAVILSAMGTMQGIDRKIIKSLKVIRKKAEAAKPAKDKCSANYYRSHTQKIENLITQLRQ